MEIHSARSRRKPKFHCPKRTSGGLEQSVRKTRSEMIWPDLRHAGRSQFDFRREPVRENGSFADGVRVFAKIADDLHQTLLFRRVFKKCAFGSSKQTLPRQFQNGIVLRRRPREKRRFDFAPDFFVAAFAARIQSHGKITFTAKSVTRVRPAMAAAFSSAPI
jgi:hypothetical protein